MYADRSNEVGAGAKLLKSVSGILPRPDHNPKTRFIPLQEALKA
jgi:hypothetical protein